MNKILTIGYFLLALNVNAASLEDLQIGREDEEEWVEFTRGSDTVMMNLYYTGSSSEAVVEITNTRIRAFAPAGTAASGFGTTSSSYSFVTTTAATLGDLCNVIDDLADYKCQLRAGRFNDLPERLRNQSAILFTDAATSTNSLKQDGGYDVFADTGGQTGTGGSPGIFTAAANATEWVRVSHQPPPGKRAIFKKCTVAGNSGAYQLEFSMYGRPRRYEGDRYFDVPINSSRTNTSYRAYGPIQVSTAITDVVAYSSSGVTIDFTNGGSEGGLEFAKDAIGIAEITPAQNGGTAVVVTQAGTSYVWCAGVDR